MDITTLSFLGCKPLLQKIDTCIYSGKKIHRYGRTTEHLKPKSKGGRNSILNYAMASRETNSSRGNMPLEDFIKRKPKILNNIKKYVLKYWDTEILGVKHGQQVASQIKKISGIDILA